MSVSEMKAAGSSEAALRHFVFLERPEGIDVADGKGFLHESR